MKDLLEYIVKSVVNNPDSVEISEKESVDFPGLTILNINVSEEDKGIVIGKKGRTINAIRDIMSINAIRSNQRVRIVIEENKDDLGTAGPKQEEQEDIFNDDI